MLGLLEDFALLMLALTGGKDSIESFFGFGALLLASMAAVFDFGHASMKRGGNSATGASLGDAVTLRLLVLLELL
jgi:hypothetical protein